MSTVTPEFEARNKELATLIAAGSRDAENDFALHNQRLVKACMRERRKSYSASQRDELESAGYLGLATAIDNLRRTTLTGDVTAYVLVAIASKMEDVPRTSDLMQPCERTKRTAKKVVEVVQEIEVPPSMQVEAELTSLATHDDGFTSDVPEAVLACCKTPRERTYVRMAAEGFTCSEIAKTVGTSVRTVERIRQTLAERYDENHVGFGRRTKRLHDANVA